MATTVLVIGSGGREHALLWQLAQSSGVGKMYVAPGNGGTHDLAESVPLNPMDIDGLVKFADHNGIGLTVVGPDNPLAAGIVDAFKRHGLPIFGPTKAAAQIEASKTFGKAIMQLADVPTAAFNVFVGYDRAFEYVSSRAFPLVVKANGLALGKGVYVCRDLVEAEKALAEILMERVHKDAGDKVIIEDFLEGIELSVHAFCDGKNAVLMPFAQDHKRIGEGDTGPNTGGMGAVAPLPWLDQFAAFDGQAVERKIVQPMLGALAQENAPFAGCLYPGLMLTKQGLRVLEFNARFGDPETQVLMRLLFLSLLPVLQSCANGTLHHGAVPSWWREKTYAACVVLAAEGYPGKPKTGMPIRGIEEAERIPGVVVFHAGTTRDEDGTIRVSGGRVLSVTATGGTLQDAVDSAYNAVERIHFDGMYYRRDIGQKTLALGS